MLNKEQIQKKIADFNTFLQTKCVDEPSALIERLSNLDVLISQSGEYLGDAKYMQDEIINGAVVTMLKKQLEERLSATTVNLYVKSEAKEFNYLVNQLERINASATHQHGGIRTRISFIKSLVNG